MFCVLLESFPFGRPFDWVFPQSLIFLMGSRKSETIGMVPTIIQVIKVFLSHQVDK